MKCRQSIIALVTLAFLACAPIAKGREEEAHSSKEKGKARGIVKEKDPQTATRNVDLGLKNCILFLGRLGGIETPSNDLEKTFNYLSTKAAFLFFLKKNGFEVSDVNPTQKMALVAEYHQQFFSQFKDPERLSIDENQSLRKSLELHGVNSTTPNARKELEILSRKNLDRILEQANLGTQPAIEPEIKTIVDGIQVFFVHSTHVLNEAPKEPILSSKRIQDYGLKGGLNSQEFNSTLMQTDDNVYFRVGFQRKGAKELDEISYYGENDLVLDSEYAKKHGWVSHYVMDARELVKFAKMTGMQFKEQEKGAFGTNLSESDLTAIRNTLHTHDFTVDDFDKLIKIVLPISLRELKQKNPRRYEIVKSILTTGIGNYTEKELSDLSERLRKRGFAEEQIARSLASLKLPHASRIKEFMKELVFDRIGMTEDFELKIPVAVPAEQVRHVRREIK